MRPTEKTYVGSDELYANVQRTLRLCAEMNSGWHTEAEVREIRKSNNLLYWSHCRCRWGQCRPRLRCRLQCFFPISLW